MLGLPARRFSRLLSSLVTALVFVVGMLSSRRARADQPGAHTVPVAVLAFDSDDAEEQADAITAALRSRVRASQGWSLIETTQTLGTLTAAFKCPARPTPECQQKIAEQIKAERYIYGFVTKGPQAGQVTAEVHLFQRGKPESAAIKEGFAENLKEGNDDTLRKIAARIVERLGGVAVGVLVVRSTEQTGDVVIDGEKHVPLANGTARLELAAGGHSVELASLGAASKRTVLVTAGQNTNVDLSPAAVARPGGSGGEQKSNGRKIVGGVVAGAGVVLGAVAVVELVRYLGLQSDGDDRAAQLNKTDTRPCREYDAQCAKIDKDAKTASGLAIGLGAAGVAAIGVGAYLFFSDPGSEKSSAAALNKTRVIPSVGPGAGSLTVVGTF